MLLVVIAADQAGGNELVKQQRIRLPSADLGRGSLRPPSQEELAIDQVFPRVPDESGRDLVELRGLQERKRERLRIPTKS